MRTPMEIQSKSDDEISPVSIPNRGCVALIRHLWSSIDGRVLLGLLTALTNLSVVVMLAIVVNPYRTDLEVVKSEIQSLQVNTPLVDSLRVAVNVSRLQGMNDLQVIGKQVQEVADQSAALYIQAKSSKEDIERLNGSLSLVNRILQASSIGTLAFNSSAGRSCLGESLVLQPFHEMSIVSLFSQPVLVWNPLVSVEYNACTMRGFDNKTWPDATSIGVHVVNLQPGVDGADLLDFTLIRDDQQTPGIRPSASIRVNGTVSLQNISLLIDQTSIASIRCIWFQIKIEY